MWPYNMTESQWLTRLEEADGDLADISPEMIQYYIARGHELRAEELSRLARNGVAGLRSLLEGLRALRPGAQDDLQGHTPAA